MSAPYYVNVIAGVIAATIDHCIMAVRNVNAGRSILLLELQIVFRSNAAGVGSGFVTRRCTAPGTPAGTVTPTAEHHGRREAPPDSGFTASGGPYSVQPTLASGELYPMWVFPAVVTSGVGVILPLDIEIPPLSQLAFVNMAAVAFQPCEWAFRVREL